MYTLNSAYSELGISGQFLNDGDVIVLHYTDDYTVEGSAISGDLDKNGKVTVYDALLVLQMSVGKREYTEEEKSLADVDGNGSITTNDALLILKYAIRAITSFEKA